MKQNTRLKLLTPILLGSLMTTSLAGIASLLLDQFFFLQQIFTLIHISFGIIFFIVFTPYIYIHIFSAFHIKQPRSIITGTLSFIIAIACLYPAIILTYRGQIESTNIYHDLHWLSSLLFSLLIIAHLMLVFFQKKDPKKYFQNKNINFKFCVYIPITLVIIFSIIITLTHRSTEPDYTNLAAVKDYQYDYGDHPFRPSQTETSTHGFIDQRLTSGSFQCGNCHKDITDQWYSSTHRMAASDPTYVTNINLLEKNKGISATRYCEGCHAPIALLSGELSEGGKHGGVENTLANIEGISCISCHRITDIVHTEGVASYEFTPAKDYLFNNSDSLFLQNISNYLIKILPNQHKLDFGMPLLAKPSYCATCHAQFMDKDMNNWGWVKMQDEYSAWLKSPFSGQSEQRFSHTEVTTCQDCHMPLVKSDDPSANTDGMIKSHNFFGSNTILPILNNDNIQLEKTIQFLQNNKVSVSIQEPHRKDADQNLMSLSQNLRKQTVNPWYYYKGEQANIQVSVANHGVGHNFPGGTTDINEAWVYFSVVDAENREVFTSGELLADDTVDNEAYFYRSLPVDRKGNLVWKHDLFNQVGNASRNIIKSGETDIVAYQFIVPYWVKSPLSISAVLRYRKLNTPYAKWALGDLYRPIPIVDMSRAYLQVPIKDLKSSVQTDD